MSASAQQPIVPAPAVRMRAVEQSFRVGLWLRRRAVLHGLDLELVSGSGLGLVGPNGSGKSTLLRLLAGVDSPREGRLEVLGGSPRDPAVRRRIGWCPEDSPFPAELRPLAALELLGTLHGLTRREARQRGQALLERTGLLAEARTPLGRFSRGMLRRFGLAQAFLHAPELVLLDEPTAGLDAPGLEVLDALVSESRARGATLVIASHLVADVHRHCEELLVLIEGRVAARGSLLELFERSGAGRGQAELLVTGLDSGSLTALAFEVHARGGHVLGVRPSQASLLALYRSLGARG